jgi:hypothetical protein
MQLTKAAEVLAKAEYRLPKLFNASQCNLLLHTPVCSRRQRLHYCPRHLATASVMEANERAMPTMVTTLLLATTTPQPDKAVHSWLKTARLAKL